MKRKSFIILITLVLAVSLMLVSAGPAMADDDPPNTVTSSRMIFEGELTYHGGGVYSGTIAMVDEETEVLGDGIAGFDVYARNGAKATYDKDSSPGQDYACGIISNHDAYTTAGGWGSYYDPDCADWYNYQLRFEDGSWYLEYNGNVGNDGDLTGASAAPMSGTMDWTAMYATETGAGAYYTGMGTPESDGYALNNGCTGINDGSSAWDMDWSWGSDYVPLQYPGFSVGISGLGGSEYRVTLTPATAGTTNLSIEVEDITAISVVPTSIDFGTLVPGQCSDEYDIAVTNVGTNEVDVSVDVSGAALFEDNLEIKNVTAPPTGYDVYTTGDWPDIITDLAMSNSETLRTQICVPSDYPPVGEETAQLIFTASS